MRAYVPSYQLISPASLGEALDVLASDEGAWQPFAGGTDLMVLLEAGKLPHKSDQGQPNIEIAYGYRRAAALRIRQESFFWSMSPISDNYVQTSLVYRGTK